MLRLVWGRWVAMALNDEPQRTRDTGVGASTCISSHSRYAVSEAHSGNVYFDFGAAMSELLRTAEFSDQTGIHSTSPFILAALWLPIYGAASLGWHTHAIRPTGTPTFSEDRFGRYSAVSVKTDSNCWTRTTYSVRSDRLKKLACLIFRPVRNAWLCRRMRLRAAGLDTLAVRALSMYATWRSAGNAPSALVSE